MAKVHNLTQLEMETDSTEVTKYIDQNNTTYADIIHECRLLMLQLKIPGIRHNFRQGNEVAHVLAKEALTQSTINKVMYYAWPTYFAEEKLEVDREGGNRFVKFVTVNTSSILANYGNLNVLGDIYGMNMKGFSTLEGQTASGRSNAMELNILQDKVLL